MEKKFKRRIFEIIEASQAHDVASQLYDAMIYVSVIVGIIPLTLRHQNIYTKVIDLIVIVVFILDYILRFYTSDYKMGIISVKAYIAYFFMPMAMIDLLSIMPVLSMIFPSAKVFGMFRLFRIIRVLKLVRYSKAMVAIANVFRRVKSQLLAVLALALIYIILSAILVFQVEPNTFETFFDALYWSTVSITTIGYGDISPVTDVGRAMTMISALVGVAIIALPSGIITAAYMDEIKKKKGKHEL